VAAQRLYDLLTLDPKGWRVSKGAPLFPKDDARPAATRG
jgi:hypothetical protein